MLSAFLGRCKFGPIKLPRKIIDAWECGWNASLQLGKTKDGWHITGVGNVYPL